MSVLEIPRIYFRGRIAWDPVTTNNYPADYDEDAADAIVGAANVSAASVATFRRQAIDQVANGAGNWNPHGTYRSPFFETTISGVDTGSGLDTGDPFVSAPVAFTGMLIDAEPYGSASSQLFFDDMSFGIAGGCRIHGKRVTRFHDRYINFSANPNNNAIAGVASVLWQTCFPKDQGLQIDSFGSPVLEALARHMDESEVLGAMVRFCTYRTVYYDDPTISNGSPGMVKRSEALRAKLYAGGFQPNPARSLLVGTVGLWRQGDPMHEPGDRALVTTGVPIPVSSDPNIHPAVCGTAFARVGTDRITLDLSNCVPAANRAPDKVELGDLTLTAADGLSGAAIVDVATIPAAAYARSAYEETSGIIDIPLDPDLAKALAGMDLTISAGEKPYLTETALRAIPADPNLYVDQGAAAAARVQVYERGVPAGAGITVTMSEIGAAQATAVTQITDAAGTAGFPLTTSVGSVAGLVFQPGPEPILPVIQLDPQKNTYMYLRVLPVDAKIAAMSPTWDNVHNFVLANWEAMAPCMDNWLRLGDPDQVLSYGPLIRKLTDPDNFESFRYMPITRDLTKGKRQLLYAFLDWAGSVNPEASVTAEAVEAPAETQDFGRLSRSMRSPQD